jgi:hypothetical protein
VVCSQSVGHGEYKVNQLFFQGENKSKPTFSRSILHHQNNSFDEFHKCGYARAHCEDAVLRNGQRARGVVCALIHPDSKEPRKSRSKNNSGPQRSQQVEKGGSTLQASGHLCDSDSLN